LTVNPIEDIHFSNIHMTTGGGGTKEDGARRSLPEYSLETMKGWWPEYYAFTNAKQCVPAYGIFASHVKGLTVSNVNITPAKQDARPAIVCDDVTSLKLAGVEAIGNSQMESVIRLQSVQQGFVHGCRVYGKSDGFVRIEGEESRDVHIADDNLCNAITWISSD